MAYPDDIDTFREIENLPGLTYDPEDKKTFFKEDLQAVRDSIMAIENFIGPESDIASGDLYLAIADLLYPVGRIVEFGAEVDPNSAFGFGTWEEYGPGRVTVGVDPSDSRFDDVGEESGSLTHRHTFMSPVGYTSAVARMISNSGFDNTMSNYGDLGNERVSSAVASKGQTDTTTSQTTQNLEQPKINTSYGDSLQPSIAVKRWIRTA